jgi:hypothetical protein
MCITTRDSFSSLPFSSRNRPKLPQRLSAGTDSGVVARRDAGAEA